MKLAELVRMKPDENAVCCVQSQCGGVRPQIAAIMEADRDRCCVSVGGVPETSEAMGNE